MISDKDCFGVLNEVFPPGKNGLREITPGCFQCPERTSCLRAALYTREGLEMKSEILERAAEKGLVSRFQRWSQKKQLHRLMKEQGKRKNDV